MKQLTVKIVTFLAGLYFLLEFLLPKKIGAFEFGFYHEQVLDGARTVGAMAIGLGVINILFVHGSRLIKRSKGGLESFAVIFGFLLMGMLQGGEFIRSESAVSTWQGFMAAKDYLEKNGEQIIQRRDAAVVERVSRFYREQRVNLAVNSATPSAASLVSASALNQAVARELELLRELETTLDATRLKAAVDGAAVAGKLAQEYYPQAAKEGLIPQLSNFLFYGFFVPLGASMFALLGFYIVSAAYNSFRARSMEAAVMLIAAVIVILGQIPHGKLYIYEHLPLVRLWLMENLNTPANRAIYFGSAIAGLAMAVRLWLSLDKNQMGGER